MNTSGDAAEQIVRLSLEGMEVAVKITGTVTKNIGAMLYAVLKDQNQPKKGKTRLTNMLKTNKELKIFSVELKDVKKFSEEAKRYGVLYCVLIDKKDKNPNVIVDIMVRAEDAAKVNRIVERFNLATADKEAVKEKVEKGKDKNTEQEAPDKGVEEKNVSDDLLDYILTKPIQKESEQTTPSNENTEGKNQSEPSLMNKNEDITKQEDKPSVKEELKEIEGKIKKEEQKNTKESEKETKAKKTNKNQHTPKRMKQPKHMQNNNKKKERSK